MKWLEIGDPSFGYISENILDSYHERGGF